jgi:hypothetical protein
LSVPWKSKCWHVPWHHQEGEDSCHALEKAMHARSIRSRNLVAPYVRQQNSPRGILELVGVQIQEAGNTQNCNMAQEES